MLCGADTPIMERSRVVSETCPTRIF